MKSVPVRIAKDFRDLTAAASQIGEWDKLGGEGKITLSVLNVGGHDPGRIVKAFFPESPAYTLGVGSPNRPCIGREKYWLKRRRDAKPQRGVE